MTQINASFLLAAQDYIPGVRRDLADAIDSDDPAYLLVEARSTVFSLEQIEKLVRAGCWRPPAGREPKRLEIVDIFQISAASVFLRIAAAITPRHQKTERAMTMLAAVTDELSWQIIHDQNEA